ncbi:phosphatidylglycerophosphatase B [Candidatus Pantoea edessiphila]|uniref:undecaprenyl-diphosphate phosphatase n=1 Tax=Candidatus Pantoea edessiphila TaxID=2044610 RepID=A0A2P5SYT7_9GAMM|nr:phosphatase PAP2 family protein [Candidatus Pantoea edessiphila]MBK4775407.1 phosphatase PAP2 family protein [Pantoea sp. Edef]PPI87463.1 phosphatidylglycerophosphatase B [Candidatus Pantoea edessiphila]
MFKIIRHTAIAISLVLTIPLIFWLLGCYWDPYTTTDLKLKLIFILMQTATNPWVILTHIMLNCCIFGCLYFNKTKITVQLFLILNIVIITGQPIKYFIKNKTQEPRPYIIWLKHKYGLNINKYYQLTNKERKITIANLIDHDQNVPSWLKQHWIKETSFAFPSGHTIFTNSWMFLIIYLLWPYRYYKTIIIVSVWSYIITLSRLLFGMHWIQDIIASIILSWILVTIAIILIDYFSLVKINR